MRHQSERGRLGVKGYIQSCKVEGWGGGKEKVRSLKEYIKYCKETFHFVSYLKYINYFRRKECSKANGEKRMRLDSRDIQLKILLLPL